MAKHLSFFGEISTQSGPDYSENIPHTIFSKTSTDAYGRSYTDEETVNFYDGTNAILNKAIGTQVQVTSDVYSGSFATLSENNSGERKQTNESQGATGSSFESGKSETNRTSTTNRANDFSYSNAGGTGSGGTTTTGSTELTSTVSNQRSTTRSPSLSYTVRNGRSELGETGVFSITKSSAGTVVTGTRTEFYAFTASYFATSQENLTIEETRLTSRTPLGSTTSLRKISQRTTQSSFDANSGETNDGVTGSTSGGGSDSNITNETTDTSGSASLSLTSETSDFFSFRIFTTSTFNGFTRSTNTSEFTVFADDETTVTARTTVIGSFESTTITRDTLITSESTSELPSATIPTIELATWSAYGNAGIAVPESIGEYSSAISDLAQSFSRSGGKQRPGKLSFIIEGGFDSSMEYTDSNFTTTDDYTETILSTTTDSSEHTFSITSFSTPGDGDFVSFFTTSSIINYFDQTTIIDQILNSTTIPTTITRSNFSTFTFVGTDIGRPEYTSTRVFFDGTSISTFSVLVNTKTVYSDATKTTGFQSAPGSRTIVRSNFEKSDLGAGDLALFRPRISIYTIKETVNFNEIAFMNQTDDRAEKRLPPDLVTFKTTTMNNGSTTTTESGAGFLRIGSARNQIALMFPDSTFSSVSGANRFSQSGSTGFSGSNLFFDFQNVGAEADLVLTMDIAGSISHLVGGGGTADSQSGVLIVGGPAKFTIDSFTSSLGQGEDFFSLLESNDLKVISAEKYVSASEESRQPFPIFTALNS